MRHEARLKTKSKPEGKIIATDISDLAIEASIKNAMTAGVDHLIDFSVCDFKETPIPPEAGVVIFNPEYGERLGEEEELELVYKDLGDFFKQKCKGKTGYIFTGNLDLAKKIGLKAKRRIEFYNAKIDCRLLEYELYEGTRKPLKAEN
jgi:putative N6-adenine-specific DNA methylase